MLTKYGTTFRWWLHPGMGLKRWLIPLLFGMVILGLGIGLILRDLYSSTSYPPLIRLLLLQMLPRWSRAIIFGSIGLTITAYSIFQLNKTLLAAFIPHEATATSIAEMVYRHRQKRRGGPNVVVVGGGTGLSVLLRGLKHHTENITAIVTVADDGGSSGRLRRELGVLPPGDFRNCIAALADDDALITQLFQYRFRQGKGLDGHSFGNLFITAMAEVTGSFERALSESGRVLNIRGEILPSTLDNVTLFAELDEGGTTRKVAGESAIPEARLPISRIYLEPDVPRAYPQTIRAILNADLIVAGPGSLYTSVIPNLMVGEISAAIEASQAVKVYICNVATQPGETEWYTLDDHVQAIENHRNLEQTHQSTTLFEFVFANSNLKHPIPPSMNLQPVQPTPPPDGRYTVIAADVVDTQAPWRHDAAKLAQALMQWYKQHLKQSNTV